MTPTAELIIEVLVARRRLGEHVWPFPHPCVRALRELEALGDIEFKSGIVDHTYNAWLTDEGRERHMDPAYEPPAQPVRRWWLRRRVRRACPAGAAVARRGIVVGSAHADRGTDSGRFTEQARIHALATVRRAMNRTTSKDENHE